MPFGLTFWLVPVPFHQHVPLLPVWFLQRSNAFGSAAFTGSHYGWFLYAGSYRAPCIALYCYPLAVR